MTITQQKTYLLISFCPQLDSSATPLCDWYWHFCFRTQTLPISFGDGLEIRLREWAVASWLVSAQTRREFLSGCLIKSTVWGIDIFALCFHHFVCVWHTYIHTHTHAHEKFMKFEQVHSVVEKVTVYTLVMWHTHTGCLSLISRDWCERKGGEVPAQEEWGQNKDLSERQPQ